MLLGISPELIRDTVKQGGPIFPDPSWERFGAADPSLVFETEALFDRLLSGRKEIHPMAAIGGAWKFRAMPAVDAHGSDETKREPRVPEWRPIHPPELGSVGELAEGFREIGQLALPASSVFLVG